MSKPFNIHDWQDKQKQLSEIRAQDVPGTAAFMGKNMRGRGMSNSEKNKASVDAFFKDLKDKEENPVVAKGDGLEITQDEMEKLHKNGRVKLKNGSVLVYMKEETINEALNPEVSRMVNRFIKGIAQKYSYSEQDAVFAIMAALKQRMMDGIKEGSCGYTPDGKSRNKPASSDLIKLKEKFPGLDDKLVMKSLIEDNPQRNAEVRATMEESYKMLEKGMDPEDIISTFKNTSRSKNASGGLPHILGV